MAPATLAGEGATVLSCRQIVSQWVLKHLTFFWVHLILFCILSLAGGVGIFVAERGSIAFIDALFTSISAVCVTGLIVVDTSVLSVPSQVIIFVLFITGGAVTTSVFPVIVRRHFVREALRKRESSVLRVEYEALGWALSIVTLYWAVIHALATISIGSYLMAPRAQSVPAPAYWWAGFTAASSFANAGFALSPDSVMSFASDHHILVSSGLLILAGNTAFPIFIRACAEIVHRLRGNNDRALTLLVRHPRRFFTHMFPLHATLSLGAVLLLLTAFQYVVYMALDWNSASYNQLGGPAKSLVSWYQSVSCRTAGFNAIDLSRVSVASQFLTIVMMFITPYPIVLSLRSSDEGLPSEPPASLPPQQTQEAPSTDEVGGGQSFRSLGSYFEHTIEVQVTGSNDATSPDVGGDAPPVAHPSTWIQRPTLRQLRSIVFQQLASETALMLTLIFLLCIGEGQRLAAGGDLSFLALLFEAVSAYGTVGLSLGYAGTVTSLSAVLSTFSKVIIMVLMMAGRHRTLPVSIDAAVYMPRLLHTPPPESTQTTWSPSNLSVRLFESFASAFSTPRRPALVEVFAGNSTCPTQSSQHADFTRKGSHNRDTRGVVRGVGVSSGGRGRRKSHSGTPAIASKHPHSGRPRAKSA